MTQLVTCDNLTDALSALAGSTAERGVRHIVFCEDRLTLLAERAVLRRQKGTFDVEVTTFSRFLTGERRVLSKQGSVMKIAALIEAHAEELGCFKKGAAQSVYETVAQLSASCVDEEMLAESAAETDGLLKRKLTDLAFLLKEYRAFLREAGMVDENGYLALLPEAIEREARGAHVVFFAFPSFTKQALGGVRAACETARSVTAILLGGGAAFCTHEAEKAFLRAAEEYGPVKKCAYPSSMQGDARRLYEGLFSPEKFGLPPIEAQSVCAFGAVDEAAEMETVCALIKRHVAEGARYRDFAVLVPDGTRLLEAEKAFSAYRIPYFADRKRPFAEHPFCAFALDVLEAVADGGLPASVDAVASSMMFGEGGDEYRNYLIKFGGYRGAVRREIKDGETVARYDREILIACRERMLGYLGLFPRKGTCAQFVGGVRALLAACDGEKKTEELAARFDGADCEFLALGRLEGVLSEMTAIAGDGKFTAHEFAALLSSGLSALGVSVIPQYADAVFLGDATESKFERTDYVFATGLTEALPRASYDTALISDRDLGKLSALRVEIEPAIAVVNARARESLANNLCAFGKRLYLSRPVRNADGETQRSEILSYAERLFRLLPLPARFPFDCCEEAPAALALLKYRARFAGGEGDARFASLAAVLGEKWGKQRVDSLLSGAQKQPVPEAEALYFGKDVSPTLLESYSNCPYAGFALRALRVREREERPVQDSDAGTFVHAVLERVAPSFNDLADEAECREAAEKAALELMQTPRFSSLSDTRAGEYAATRLIGECREVAAAAYVQLAHSAFRVRETEAEISLPNLSLRGRTDRVDAAGDYVRVIDYKTGEIDDKAISYYTGRRLQLQLYLLGASEGGKPAGAFYFPAAESFTPEGEEKFRMRGFFNKEEEVLGLMDKDREVGKKSAFFEGGGRTEKGMTEEDFSDFLAYARLYAAQAEQEMRAGNVAPSPYDGACAYCKLLGACGFTGTPRKEEKTGPKDIVDIVRRERGEEE